MPPHFPERTVRPPKRPVLVYDDGCSLCRRSAGWARRWCGVVLCRRSEAMALFPDLPRDTFDRAVVWAEVDGRLWRGAAAVYRAGAGRPIGARLWRRYRRGGLFARVSDGVYAGVARVRGPLSRAMDLAWGAPPEDL